MIFLYFNYRGLASQPKKLAFRELVRSQNLDIVLLQETLGKGDDVICSISKLLPNWVFYALDAVGRSRGMVTGFNPKKFRYVSS